MFNFFKKRKYRDYQFNPDEIFMDTLNVSHLNTQQFEGVMEKPLSYKKIYFFIALILLIFCIFLFKLVDLQIIHGDEFLAKSENNTLRKKPIFAERGVIYDRFNTELAWNKEALKEKEYLDRAYISQSGFGHILGYVNYPQKDKNNFYWRHDIQGQAALEKQYDELLRGENGALLFEVDAVGNKISENNILPSTDGKNLYTTLDAQLQNALFESIKKQAIDFGFDAGSGLIMDINTGELLSMTSYPEYDPYVLAEGEDSEKINNFFNNPQKPFLNRAISGMYPAGSIIKPFLGLAALHEGIITENTKINSTGQISIPNKYNPNQPSIFKDWRSGGHGLSDIRFAIADSVNTFFYAIGGGYQEQKGLGITKIEEYLRVFSFAQKTGINFGYEKTGVIPSPEWKKKKYSDGRWRLGDTYITSIGQFGFLVSPIQMLRSVAALANKGELLTPVLVFDEQEEPVSVPVIFSDKNYQIIHDAMRDTVTKGTAQNINVFFVDIAAKTGTAQFGVHNEWYNSWIIGFFPYHDPKYAFTILMEKGKRGGSGAASKAMRDFINTVNDQYPEFWKSLR